MSIQPITPEDLKKEFKVPDFVVKVVNKLLADEYATSNSFSISLLQDDIVKALCKEKGVKSQKVFDNGWLNFEETYNRCGWKVEYDKPAYNETYPAIFKFSKKRSD